MKLRVLLKLRPVNSQLSKKVVLFSTIFFCGSFITFIIAASLNISSILSACAVTLAGSLIPGVKARLEALLYCSCFAGMCSGELGLGAISFIVISVIGALLFIVLDDKFTGLGGKLGTIAFLACAIFVLTRHSYA